MRTSGLFTVSEFRIKSKKLEPFYLGFSGCWHVNSPNCDRGKLIKFLRKVESYGGDILGMGDYFDGVSATTRAWLKGEQRDEVNITLSKAYERDVDELVDVIKTNFTGRFIGLLGGNHYFKFPSSITSDQKLAEKLNCKFLGVASFVRVIYNYGKKSFSLDICGHHGKGGQTLNILHKMANMFHADIVLQGHNHDRFVDYINRLCLNASGNLINKKILVGRTGSFLKAYEDGEVSYAVDGLYSPADLGGIIVKITPERVKTKTMDRMRFEIEAII